MLLQEIPTATISDFRTHTREHFSRLRESGGAEVLTDDKGEAQGVVMSTDAFERMAQAEENRRVRDSIRISMKQFEEGKGRPAEQALRELAAELGIQLSR